LQCGLQAEAALIKSLTSGGSATKVVTLGIGSGVDQSELEDIASSPGSRNVILVQDFNNLTSVEQQLRNDICTGKVLLSHCRRNAVTDKSVAILEYGNGYMCGE